MILVIRNSTGIRLIKCKHLFLYQNHQTGEVPTAGERWDFLTSLNPSSITKRICLGSPRLHGEIIEIINDLAFGKVPGIHSLSRLFEALSAFFNALLDSEHSKEAGGFWLHLYTILLEVYLTTSLV